MELIDLETALEQQHRHDGRQGNTEVLTSVPTLRRDGINPGLNCSVAFGPLTEVIEFI
jgi:hypothetical protein